MPASAGMPSERARIATCEVAPPRVVQKPTTRVRSSAAVSDGVRSSAMRMVFGGYSGCADVGAGEQREHAQADVAHVVGALREQLVAQRGEPVRVRRRPRFFHAKAALLPLAMPDSAISSRSGSSSSSSCAAKIAAFAGSALA